jgi:hypothetical protein
VSYLLACVIQWPQSGIQRQPTDANTDIEEVIEAEFLGIDAEYEALVAEYSAVLV